MALEKQVLIKVNDEVSPILREISENLRHITTLLVDNKKLLEKFVQRSLEVVNGPLQPPELVSGDLELGSAPASDDLAG